MRELIDRLKKQRRLEKEEWMALIGAGAEKEYLFAKAREEAQSYYGNSVFVRGLIEFTNYCKNNCYYCGIRRDNACVGRYRLTEEEILSCCKKGHALGLRTFVLQGGEELGIYMVEQDFEKMAGQIFRCLKQQNEGDSGWKASSYHMRGKPQF